MKRIILPVTGAILIILLNGCGGSGIKSLPPTVSLTADKTWVDEGGKVTLTWTSMNANKVTSCNFGTTVLNGTIDVIPTIDTQYTIMVSGDGGTFEADVPIKVYPRNELLGTWKSANKKTILLDTEMITYNMDSNNNWVVSNDFIKTSGSKYVVFQNGVLEYGFLIYIYGGYREFPQGRYQISPTTGDLEIADFNSSNNPYAPPASWGDWQDTGETK